MVARGFPGYRQVPACRLATVKTSPGATAAVQIVHSSRTVTMPARPSGFGPMFSAGTRYGWPDGTHSVIEVHVVGELINIIIFKCGMGDGSYRVWFARAASQDPVCFLADLELQHSLGPAANEPRH